MMILICNAFFVYLVCLFVLTLGSGRVTFNNSKSFMKAVAAAFVEIKTTKFTKKVSGVRGSARSQGRADGSGSHTICVLESTSRLGCDACMLRFPSHLKNGQEKKSCLK